ncbi:hypothetical protein C7441_11035 [Pseudaminobacter salicylatoxidans]|uniref:Uncharacterized protein n=1 Tax=Pseudaminobacter salicylatoxidans TaxID=93369 RepID=A0A316C0G1_PSESE|nr:hypothetical protein [Pseudaminobacter salicylatoxidans]PWJ81503.1 hypothetical protein C7441_11035 [Pseudaminobacter salicylatoxidans]
MPRDEVEKIDAISQSAVDSYLHRSSVTYLECCISLMLTHMSREQVVEILRSEANMLEELG